MYVSSYVSMCTCSDERLMISNLLDHSPFYLLRQGVPPDPELTYLVILGSMLPLLFPVLWLLHLPGIEWVLKIETLIFTFTQQVH